MTPPPLPDVLDLLAERPHRLAFYAVAVEEWIAEVRARIAIAFETLADRGTADEREQARRWLGVRGLLPSTRAIPDVEPVQEPMRDEAADLAAGECNGEEEEDAA